MRTADSLICGVSVQQLDNVVGGGGSLHTAAGARFAVCGSVRLPLRCLRCRHRPSIVLSCDF
eukprot:6605965-Prymnesium_polylepis.1